MAKLVVCVHSCAPLEAGKAQVNFHAFVDDDPATEIDSGATIEFSVLPSAATRNQAVKDAARAAVQAAKGRTIAAVDVELIGGFVA
jgi:hypothetical protein